MSRGYWDHLKRDLEAPPQAEGVDKNSAIRFPILDRWFGTYYLPKGKWPSSSAVPEAVPRGYLAQLKYPFVRQQE